MFVNREQATDEGSVMDVVQADAQIDAFIERRSRQSPEQRPEEVMYAESVRRYHRRRRKEIAALWFAHFCRMAENHARISEDYERRAEELCKEGTA
jgi:hypothetical protein